MIIIVRMPQNYRYDFKSDLEPQNDQTIVVLKRLGTLFSAYVTVAGCTLCKTNRKWVLHLFARSVRSKLFHIHKNLEK